MIRRLWKDRRGTSAIEFAIIFPCAFLLLIAVVEFQAYVANERRVIAAAGTLADVAGRRENVKETDIRVMLGGSSYLVEAQGGATLQPRLLRVSSIRLNGATGEVVWSVAKEGAALTAGSAVDIASLARGSFQCPNGMAILAEIKASYTPSFGLIFSTHIIHLRQHALSCPRTRAGVLMVS